MHVIPRRKYFTLILYGVTDHVKVEREYKEKKK